MKGLALSLMIFALLTAGAARAAGTSGTVTLHPSTLTFKQAIAQCAGSLGSVTFTLGHARVASLPGVSDQTDTASSGIDVVTFTNDKTGKSAVIKANGHDNTVTAKNVQVKSNNQLACINAD